MMMLPELGLLFFFGAIAGVLSGLLGIGGGIVIVPFLVWHFAALGFQEDLIMVMAVGSSLTTILFTALSSSWAHHRRGMIDWSTVKRLSPGLLIGSSFGAMAANLLPTLWFKMIFGGFLLIVAYRMVRKPQTESLKKTHQRRPQGHQGIVIGGLSSLLGIGGGTLSVPYLMHCGIPLHRAIGTSAALGFPIALAGSVTYVALGLDRITLPPGSLGLIYFPAVLGISLTSVPFAPLGAALAHRWPTKNLRTLFAILLAFGGMKLLYQGLQGL